MLDKIDPRRAKTINLLKEGEVGVLATDTIYGLVGSALNPATVEHMYVLRGRTPEKPMVILISSLGDLTIFKIKLDDFLKQFLLRVWPGKVSVILPCPNSEFKYLHRGTENLALRIPQKEDLVELIRQTGPLVAPSANPEGLAPAKTLEEAKSYFGDKADFYLDEGQLEGLPSTLVAFENGRVVIKRAGAVDVLNLLE